MRESEGAVLMLSATLCLVACQSPTDPDEPTDFVDVSVTPDPAAAGGPDRPHVQGRGRRRRPRRDPRIRLADRPSRSTVTLNQNATAENVSLDFPVDITAATVRVQQASGGIVTPPTGGDTERYDFVIAQATSNRFTGVNMPDRHDVRGLVRPAQPAQGGARQRDAEPARREGRPRSPRSCR